MTGWLGKLQVSHGVSHPKLLSGEFQGKGKRQCPAFELLLRLKMPLLSPADISVGKLLAPNQQYG